jgi:hypothetical protein
MTSTEYEAGICARIREARVVPFRSVSIGDWHPKVAACHENVDEWVQANPGASAVRGWVIWWTGGDEMFVLTAHSVVRDVKGQIFDITPLGDERQRPGMHFIAHTGDEGTWLSRKTGEIRCVGGRPWEPPAIWNGDILSGEADGLG